MLSFPEIYLVFQKHIKINCFYKYIFTHKWRYTTSANNILKPCLYINLFNAKMHLSQIPLIKSTIIGILYNSRGHQAHLEIISANRMRLQNKVIYLHICLDLLFFNLRAFDFFILPSILPNYFYIKHRMKKRKNKHLRLTINSFSEAQLYQKHPLIKFPLFLFFQAVVLPLRL